MRQELGTSHRISRPKSGTPGQDATVKQIYVRGDEMAQQETMSLVRSIRYPYLTLGILGGRTRREPAFRDQRSWLLAVDARASRSAGRGVGRLAALGFAESLGAAVAGGLHHVDRLPHSEPRDQFPWRHPPEPVAELAFVGRAVFGLHPALEVDTRPLVVHTGPGVGVDGPPRVDRRAERLAPAHALPRPSLS